MLNDDYITITIKKSDYNDLNFLAKKEAKSKLSVISYLVKKRVKEIGAENTKEDTFETARKEISKAMKKAGIKKKISPDELRIEEAYL